MNRKLVIAGIAVCVCAVVAFVVGQTLLPGPRADTLSEALDLLVKGNAQQAQELLGAIGPGDPRYEAARRYVALCMHEQGDWRGFFEQVKGIDLNAPVVPAAVREELAFRRIDALFRARKFEEIFLGDRRVRATISWLGAFGCSD